MVIGFDPSTAFYSLGPLGTVEVVTTAVDLLDLIFREMRWRTERERKEIEKIQAELFGLHESDFAPLIGENKWISDSSGEVFGKQAYNYAIPPYNLLGVRELACKLGRRLEKANEEWPPRDLPSNLCVLGRASLHPKIQEYLKAYSRLPLHFVDEKCLPEDVRPSQARGVLRVYKHVDKKGVTIYRKLSQTGRCLINEESDPKRPLGPFVSADHNITGDVLLMNVLPNPFKKKRDGKRRGHLIWVTAGYGATARVSDLFLNHKILRQMWREVLNQVGEPWFQAAFTMKVSHSAQKEVYGHPILNCFYPIPPTKLR